MISRGLAPIKRYYVEGLFIPRKHLKKVQQGNRPVPIEVEPFARTFWANDPGEALRLAAEALDGGQWLETPRISMTSEEQRMRQAGAPELPGFAPPPVSSARKKDKSSKR
jgi:hypothetical protein